MSEYYKKRLLKLLKRHAYCRRPVVLSSGRDSDYYVDVKRVSLMPEGAYLTGMVVLSVLEDDTAGFDAICGVALGGVPVATATSLCGFICGRDLRSFIVRDSKKKHGLRGCVEGPVLPSGSTVVVVDDVATTGGSILRAIKTVEKKGFRVVKAVVLVDRLEGARERLNNSNYDFVSVFDKSDILDN